jgi:hypothetical protein
MVHREASLDSFAPATAPPPPGASYDDSSPWAKALADLVHPYEATTEISENARCAATEMARVVATAQGLPTDEPSAVHRRALRRCVSFDRAIAVVAVADDLARLDETEHRIDGQGRVAIEGHVTAPDVRRGIRDDGTEPRRAGPTLAAGEEWATPDDGAHRSSPARGVPLGAAPGVRRRRALNGQRRGDTSRLDSAPGRDDVDPLTALLEKRRLLVKSGALGGKNHALSMD